MELTPEDREKVWLLLADLFFLDTEPTEWDYQATADCVQRMGLGRQEVQTILLREVAPIAGANLGYLLWPVIGIWGGFESASLCSRIAAYAARRAARPQWLYSLQDRFIRWMVRQLEPEKLLDRLPQ